MSVKYRTEGQRALHLLTRKVDKAIRQHNMIADGDRILIGVSGGKDSLSLLSLLHYGLRFSAKKYELVAAHIRGDARGADIPLSNEMIQWVESLGIQTVVRDISLTEDESLPMDCGRCSKSRRKTLFYMTEEFGCNKLALGHNADDFAHTALMNLFLHGRLETMGYCNEYFGGAFTLIRPIAYLREHELIRLAKACAMPVMKSGCPLTGTSKRKSAHDFMAGIDKEFRHAGLNIIRAASPGCDTE